jgi:hypothetical protein
MPIGGGGGGSSTITVGTTTLTGGTTGSVLFVGAASVLQQANANFFWDNTNNRLGIANAAAKTASMPTLVTGDYLVIGRTDVDGNSSAKTTILFTNNGTGGASNANTSSGGDKLVFFNGFSLKDAIGVDSNASLYIQAQTNAATGGILFVTNSSATAVERARITAEGRLCVANASVVATGQTALATGDYAVLGLSGTSSASNRTTIVFNNQGWAGPSTFDATSNGDKLVFRNDASGKIAIGRNGGVLWFQSKSGVVGDGFEWYYHNTKIMAFETGATRGLQIGDGTISAATSQTAYTFGDLLRLGNGGTSNGGNKTTLIFNNQGWANPSNANTTSSGDKIVFWNASNQKTAIGFDGTNSMWFQSTGNGSSSFYWVTSTDATATERMRLLGSNGCLGIGVTSPTAYVHVAASTTSVASIRIPAGTAPSAPNSGDFWYDGTNLKFRDGATTRTITWT